MRKVLLAILCLMVLPQMASAEVQNCFGCVLGLYGDQNMTQVTATLPANTPTDIFLGIKFDEHNVFNGLTGVEFSVAGISGSVILASFDTIVPATLVLGSLPAPADTSSGSVGTGGMNISWSTCLAGSQAIGKLSLIAFGAVSDRVFQIKHKYPPSNPTSWNTPIFTLCDAPQFTATRITEACLVANPTSTPPACAIGVTNLSWEGVKELYR